MGRLIETKGGIKIIRKLIQYSLILLFFSSIQLLGPTAYASAADLPIDVSADIFKDDDGVYANFYASARTAYELYFGYDYEYGRVSKAAVRFDLNGIDSSQPIQKAELKIYVCI